ncbi:MAG: CBS domain-containing protein [Nitrospirota bacterium]|nr:CBS domain-containing protein [Nitrospirota bacterium]
MLKAKDVMTQDVIIVTEGMSVDELGRLFIEKKISGAPVTDAKGALIGIVTENDLIRRNARLHIPTVLRIFDAIIPLGRPDSVEEEIKKMSASTVGEICTKKVLSVAPDASIQDVSSIMFEKGVHLLPVLEAGRIVGIIGKIDIIRSMTNETAQQKPG